MKSHAQLSLTGSFTVAFLIGISNFISVSSAPLAHLILASTRLQTQAKLYARLSHFLVVHSKLVQFDARSNTEFSRIFLCVILDSVFGSAKLIKQITVRSFSMNSSFFGCCCDEITRLSNQFIPAFKLTSRQSEE